MRTTHADILQMMEESSLSEIYGSSVMHNLIPDKPISLTAVDGVLLENIIRSDYDPSSLPETLDSGRSLYGSSNGTGYVLRALPNDAVDLSVSERHMQIMSPSSGGWIAVINDAVIAGIAVDSVCD